MCSISNVISTRKGKRFPWRRLLFALLLAAAVASLLLAVVPPGIREYRESRRLHDLTDIGAPVESVEGLPAEGVGDPVKVLGDALAPLFVDGELAAVRVWGVNGNLLGEITRNHPAEIRTENTLEEIARPAAAPARELPAADRELFLVLQQLIADQFELMSRMDDALQAGKGAGVHSGLYVIAYDNLALLKQQQARHALLDDAAMAMDSALIKLTHSDEASMRQAMEETGEAVIYLSIALEDLRATGDMVPLPATLAAAAPPAAGWLHTMLPTHGRRLSVPLYTASGDESLIMDAGTAEFIFYDRTADLITSAAGYALQPSVLRQPAVYRWPAGFLLAALLALVPWRRGKDKSVKMSFEGTQR